MMHTEKTPSETCRTLIIFLLFGAVSRKVVGEKQEQLYERCVVWRARVIVAYIA